MRRLWLFVHFSRHQDPTTVPKCRLHQDKTGVLRVQLQQTASTMCSSSRSEQIFITLPTLTSKFGFTCIRRLSYYLPSCFHLNTSYSHGEEGAVIQINRFIKRSIKYIVAIYRVLGCLSCYAGPSSFPSRGKESLRWCTTEVLENCSYRSDSWWT